MKIKLIGLMVSLFLLAGTAVAQTFINLTPRPKSISVKAGQQLTLPSKFSISHSGLAEEEVNEVKRFADLYAAVTGAEVSVVADDADALFQVSKLDATSKLKDSGYTLAVTFDKVNIQAKSATGFFYAFQSVKKLLPANVMAGKKDPLATEHAIPTYTIPLVTISDEPRFDYRGFMLDVSRHFFTVDEVKRMLDVMSYYKMNAFHWHLTDDQGWRVEIKKYPKLTTVGSIAPNSLFTDLYEAKQYWINKPYGPYFYTQDEIRDVVAYAKERHITIVPEVDMPGHSSAAMASYPEYSCNPSGGHQVWSKGGISYDVINIANPAAVQFAKDVLSEIMDLFPGERIHIGGDECPVDAWKNNAECQALYKAKGFTNYRQLQSYFIQELSEFVKERGRKLAVWNEAITADGSDLDVIKATGAEVFCWNPAQQSVKQAKTLGLPTVFTPYGPYYINRKQGNSEQDPPNAGDGSDHVKNTYACDIPAEVTGGVQGTFWTENVSNADLMEWSALPRLIAIAERGWSPESSKNFVGFQKRMTADTVLLNYGGYKYCKYYMLGEEAPGTTSKVLPRVNTADKKYYYRIVSGGEDAARSGRCIEVLAEGSPLIATYQGNGAAAGRLWTNTQAAATDNNYDNQWWSLEEDPKTPGKYALVCKAFPDGSVNATPTAKTVSGRWTYDKTGKHYNFVLGAKGYGQKGNNYYYSLSSDQTPGLYLNSSVAKQGMSVNIYSNPSDGRGGLWEFSPMENYGNGDPVSFDYLKDGQTYSFINTVSGYDATALSDNKKGSYLQHSADAYANNAWIVEASTVNADGSQTLKLKNAATGRYITSVGSYSDREGSPVSVGTSISKANVTLTYVPKYKELRIKVAGKSLFPLPSGQVNAGATTSASSDAPRVQGAGWKAEAVKVITINCKDDKGAVLGKVLRSVPTYVAELTAEYCPEYKNTKVESITPVGENTYDVVYKRVAYALTIQCTDQKGAWLSNETVNVPIGETYTVKIPECKYYTLASSDVADGETLTLDADRTLHLVYATDALTGVKADGEVVTKLEAGKSYLFYDATTAPGRAGYRAILSGNAINRYTAAEGMPPTAIWTLEGSGSRFKVKNEHTALYVPQLVSSTPTTASKTGGLFTFALNGDGTTWNIKGANGQYWDGLESGALVGWGSGTGHPIRISTFFAQPMYTVTITCVDELEKVISETTELLPAGQAYTLTIPTFNEYTLAGVSGNEDYQGTIEGYVHITAKFKKNVVDGIGSVVNDAKASQIFDLQGRRLNRISQRGIYIINGKKTLVR